MRDGIRVLVLTILGLVVVMGCSSGGASPTTAGSQAAPGASSAAGASQAPAAASVAAVPSKAPAGGGSGGGVCTLVTTDELAGIYSTPVTTTVIAGPPDTCKVEAAGKQIAAWVLTTSGGKPVFDAYAGDPDATTVSGIGDKAAYSPGSQLFVILKGDTLFSMSSYDQAKTPEERLELMKKVGTIAAGRM
jgi:hypothetical protein